MSEQLLLALLQRAEAWANRAGQSLARRHAWTPATFSVGRRPEERALLAAACEVYDLLGATPEGCVLLAELNLHADAGMCALPSHDGVVAAFVAHRCRVDAAVASAAGSVDGRAL